MLRTRRHPGESRDPHSGTGSDPCMTLRHDGSGMRDVHHSVAEMRRVIAGLVPADNGRFIDHDGSPLAW